MKEENLSFHNAEIENYHSNSTKNCLKNQHAKELPDIEIELCQLSGKNFEDFEQMREYNSFKHYDIELKKRMASKRHMEIIMRTASAVILLIALWWFRRGKKAGMYQDGFCLIDQGHIWTSSINKLCHKSKAWLTFFEVTSSGTMDLVFLALLIFWFIWGKTGEVLWKVAIFYGIRGFVQGNFKMRYPDQGIWDYPGIPSIVVPYGLQSDYYFSGHCGFLAINIATHWNWGNKKFAIFIACILPYVAFTLIMSRIHYTIDIPIGIMFGFYVHLMVKPHVKKLDRTFSKIFSGIKNRLCKFH